MFLGYDEVLKVHYLSRLRLGASKSHKERLESWMVLRYRCQTVDLAQNSHLSNFGETGPF